MENSNGVPPGLAGDEIDGSRRSRGFLIRLEAEVFLEAVFARISLPMKVNTRSRADGTMKFTVKMDIVHFTRIANSGV